MTASDDFLMALIREIAAANASAALERLAASPELAHATFKHGATREQARDYFLDEIRHHVNAGDTALHIAAAAAHLDVIDALLTAGANVRAKNRRGAEPLHYAVDGGPGSPTWNPRTQAVVIARLIRAGGDPNETDRSGVTPLHRAVRTRCAAAVAELLKSGADAHRKTKSGSTPMQLASHNTGRSGSGSAEAKAQQAEIVRLLIQFGANA